MSFTLDELRAGTSGRVLLAERDSFPGASIDSRAVEPGEVFFALRGTKVDGHDFIEGALAQGAGGAVMSEEKATPAFLHKLRKFRNTSIVAVDDPQNALSRMGGHHRTSLPELQVVGITGSNGKTTTKEILATILSSVGPTLATRGNLNNHIGVPLTLLRLDHSHRFAVIEMGASGPGEIDALARMTRPRIAILTNIAPAHLEGFGGLEGVRRSKGELLRHVAVSGTLIVNLDDAGALSLSDEFDGKKVRFSIQGLPADVRATEISPAGIDGMSFVLHMGEKSKVIRLPLIGEHNVANAVAASAAAYALGTSLETIAKALERVRPAEMRSDVRVGPDGTALLVDCYNANPASMSKALAALAKMPGSGRRIAVLGQMNELGSSAEEFHRALGEEAARQGVEWLLYTGQWADAVLEGARRGGLEKAASYPSHEEIQSALAREMKPGDRILIKGSRGAQMEKIARPLMRRIEQARQEALKEKAS